MIRSIIGRALGMTVLVSCGIFASAASAQQVACVAYDGASFGGQRLSLEDGRSYEQLQNLGWNDRISSVAISPGCRMRVGEHVFFNGDNAIVTGNIPQLEARINNRISSLSCACGGGDTGRASRSGQRAQQPIVSFDNPNANSAQRQAQQRRSQTSQYQFSANRPGCAAYEHSNFQGKEISLRPGEIASQLAPRNWNDIITGVRVTRGCALEVGEHHDFKGKRRLISRDIDHVGAEWNDKISALSCQCDGYQNTRAWTPPAPKLAKLVRGGPACRIFSRQSFNGTSVTLRENEKVARFGQRFSGKASSMQLAPGCAMVLDIGEAYKIWIDKDDAVFRGGLNNAAVGAACYCPVQ